MWVPWPEPSPTSRACSRHGGRGSSGPHSAATPVPDYTKALTGNIKGLRIGVPTEHFFEHVHPETEAALRSAISLLKEHGGHVGGCQSARRRLCGAASSIILGSESAVYHEKRLKSKAIFSQPLVRERLEVATFNSAVDYIKACASARVLMEEMRRVFQTCDVLMLPAGNAAPKLDAEIVGTDAPTDPPLQPRPDSYNSPT